MTFFKVEEVLEGKLGGLDGGEKKTEIGCF